MAAYTDYQFYQETYLGNAISADDFPRLALRASAVIERLSFGRAAALVQSGEQADAETFERIQLATCAVAEELQTQEAGSQPDGLASERVGNYAVSYGAGASAALSNAARQEKAARAYLETTGLMYRGITQEEGA